MPSECEAAEDCKQSEIVLFNMDEQYKMTVNTQRAPVIEPGHTFGTVTEKISAIVLTRPASNGWFLGFGVASCSR